MVYFFVLDVSKNSFPYFQIFRKNIEPLLKKKKFSVIAYSGNDVRCFTPHKDIYQLRDFLSDILEHPIPDACQYNYLLYTLDKYIKPGDMAFMLGQQKEYEVPLIDTETTLKSLSKKNVRVHCYYNEYSRVFFSKVGFYTSTDVIPIPSTPGAFYEDISAKTRS